LTEVPEVFSLISNNNNNNGVGSGFGSKRNVVAHLADLSLGDNVGIDMIKNDAFSAAKNLISLDLRGCRITAIDIQAFRGLGMLRKLILIDNNMMSIPTTSFSHLIQLETLKIGRNPFNAISKYAFGGLKKLKTLEIGGAQELSFIEPDALANNLDLDNVEISACKKLATLPPKLFKGLSGFKNLNLKVNHFVEFTFSLSLTSYYFVTNVCLQFSKTLYTFLSLFVNIFQKF
jgi:Leucine-rich repeat (LRR) protein